MTEFINPRMKLLQHIDKLVNIKAGLHPAPVNAEIDLSNRCNLGCEGCHMSYLHTAGLHAHKVALAGDLMDTDMALDMLKQLKDFGVKSVTWTGGGEPTLHPDFDKIIEANELEQGIYTNGTLLNPDRAKLLKRKMKWIYISLDRSNKQSYLAYKKRDLFTQVNHGIKRLVEAEGDATIGIGYLIDGDNLHEIPAMVHHAIRFLDVDYVQFRPLVTPGVDRSWVTDALPLLKSAAISSKVIADLGRFEMYWNWGGFPYPTCYWSQLQTTITPDGSVWTCVNRRGFDGDKLGNLHDEPFADIWARSDKFQINGDCRLMCRGSLANPVLNEMFSKQAHGNFI